MSTRKGRPKAEPPTRDAPTCRYPTLTISPERRENGKACAVELAAGAVVQRLGAALAGTGIGNDVVFARIELDLGDRRLGQRAHVGNGDRLVPPVAVALAHAEQHANI